jgi:hypothetical protein
MDAIAEPKRTGAIEQRTVQLTPGRQRPARMPLRGR